jgi:hypothetical protein
MAIEYRKQENFEVSVNEYEQPLERSSNNNQYSESQEEDHSRESKH